MKFIVLRFCLLMVLSGNVWAGKFLQFERSWPPLNTDISARDYIDITGDDKYVYLLQRYTSTVDKLTHDGFLVDRFRVLVSLENPECVAERVKIIDENLHVAENCDGLATDTVYAYDKYGERVPLENYSITAGIEGFEKHNDDFYLWLKGQRSEEGSEERISTIILYKNNERIITLDIDYDSSTDRWLYGADVSVCFDDEYMYIVYSYDGLNQFRYLTKNLDTGENYLDNDGLQILGLDEKEGPVSCSINNGEMLLTSSYGGRYLVNFNGGIYSTHQVLIASFLNQDIHDGKASYINKVVRSYIDQEGGNFFDLHYLDGIRILDENLNLKLDTSNYSEESQFSGISDALIKNDSTGGSNRFFVQDNPDNTSRTQKFSLDGQAINLNSDEQDIFNGSFVTQQIIPLNYKLGRRYDFQFIGNDEGSRLAMPEYIPSPDIDNCGDSSAGSVSGISISYNLKTWDGTTDNIKLYSSENGVKKIAKLYLDGNQEGLIHQCNSSGLALDWDRLSGNRISVLRPFGLISVFDTNGVGNVFSISDILQSNMANYSGTIHEYGDLEILQTGFSNIHAAVDENTWYIPNLIHEQPNFPLFSALYRIDATSETTGTVEPVMDSAGLFPNIVNKMVFHEGKLYVASDVDISVFSVIDIPENSKAIIIAGGEPNESNPLWDETQANAHKAFLSLANRGFTKDSIKYFSHNTDFDLDNNGALDDVDGVPSLENIEDAIVNWAAGAEDVIIYMIGHGGDGTFDLGSEILYATDLNAWLNTLQDDPSTSATVIYDACYSGSFQEPLQSNYTRNIITSSGAGQRAYFQGSISFSNQFWDAIFTGKSVGSAFSQAKAVVEASFTSTDNEGNPIKQQEPFPIGDIEDKYIGSGITVTSDDRPRITSVEVDKDTFTITADLSELDSENANSVWAQIIPSYIQYNQHGGTPVLKTPRIYLSLQDDGSYQGAYDGFDEPGTYQIVVLAKGKNGAVSEPVVRTLNVDSPYKRKAIIVAGHSAQQSADWVKRLAGQATNALILQGYDPTNIQYLGEYDIQYLIDNHHPQFNNLSKSTLRNLLISSSGDPSGSWAGSGTSDLVIYLVGDASKQGVFPLSKDESGNTTESLLTSELNEWLNALQDQDQGYIQGTVTVVQEGNYSGNLIQSLDTFQDKSRVVISSSASNQASEKSFDQNFSQYFWNRISLGNSVKEAFKEARSRLEGRQHAQINLNGDKKSNGKNEIRSAHYHLGFGMAIASDEPVIGSVAENTTLQDTTQSALWASDIDTLSPLKKVWAVIEPPDYDPVNHQTGELVEVQLTDDDQDDQWEATWDGFNAVGIYAVHYYAMDEKDSISAPHTSYVTQTQGPDAYEPDDDFASASLLSANTHFRQRHNFHHVDDLDFIQFYANHDYGQYTIKVDSTDSQADTVITLYDCSTKAEVLMDVDDAPADSYELIYWTPPSAGSYCLKIKPYDENSVHADMENGYTLSVFPTDAPQDAVIQGTVKDESGNPIVGAIVYADSNERTTTNEQGVYALGLEGGDITLTAETSGYKDEITLLTVAAGNSGSYDFVLQNSNRPTDDPIEDKIIRPMKPPKTEIEAGHNEPVVMQVLEITVPDGGAGLHKVTLTSRGTGNEATDIRSVKLYHDINQNDVVDPGDPLIGSGKTFTRDNGSIIFNLADNGNPYSFGTPGPQRILVTFERK